VVEEEISNNLPDHAKLQSDKDVAEDYRRQRQAADARRLKVAPRAPSEQLKWIDENPDLLLAIARSVSAGLGNEVETIEEYKQALKNTSEGSMFDDLHARQVLERLLKEIEGACIKHGIPIRGGAVIGTMRQPGFLVGQFTVLETASSIIDATIPFLAFCNLVTKLLAQTLPISSDGRTAVVSHSPAEVRKRLEESPGLTTAWKQLFAGSAISLLPPSDFSNVFDIATTVTRIMLIRAVELFVIAHEYGHHVMEHGQVDSSEPEKTAFEQEHEADLFARAASIAIGAAEEPPNGFAMFGVGAVVILGALDLVRRATALIETGDERPKPREHHPSYPERIEALAVLDDRLAPKNCPEAAEMRTCFMQIVEVIWDTVRDHIADLRRQGVRPHSRNTDPSGWLPG
jgi:hypothetical protein